MKHKAAIGIVVLAGMALTLSAGAAGLGSPLPLTGVNLAGGEFYRPRPGIRPVYSKDYVYPNKAEIEYFAAQGMNLFRYPFLWETLQPELKAPLDAADLARLKTAVGYATSQGLVVLLDPHNYARYFRTNLIGGPAVSVADFADFWHRLAQEFKGDPYVWFGLMNEPHDMPTQQWFDAANAAIAGIRSAGANQLILVPGNAWTGAHSWTNEDHRGSNARHILSLRDPLDYWVIEVHQYVDDDNSGRHRAVVSPTIGSERLRAFVAWCREHQKRAVLGEFGMPLVPDAEQCCDDMLSSMERDRDVWLGWSWWAAGSRWGDYMFTLEPKNGADRPQMAWLHPHLHGTALPRFTLSVKDSPSPRQVGACSAPMIEAPTPPPGLKFKVWMGDTAWLKDPTSPKTSLTMPFKNVRLEAVFVAAR
jgi:endoglucanase